MFRQTLSLWAAVIALSALAGIPGQAQAQRGRAGSRSGFHSNMGGFHTGMARPFFDRDFHRFDHRLDGFRSPIGPIRFTRPFDGVSSGIGPTRFDRPIEVFGPGMSRPMVNR
jgi:hypothetical protein